MSEQPNILFIVEGEQLEPEVISRIGEVYGLRCDITSVCTNIHILYQQLKKDDGYSDVIPVLRKSFAHAWLRWKTTKPARSSNAGFAERRRIWQN